MALITGASQGIGASVLRELAHAGATVIGCARHLPAHRIPHTSFYQTDITQPQAVQSMIDDVVEHHQCIHILVNNASILGPRGVIKDISLQAWRETLDINLTGMFIVTSAVLTVMADQGDGAVARGSGPADRLVAKDHRSFAGTGAPPRPGASARSEGAVARGSVPGASVRSEGAIVNISSGAGRRGNATWGAYAASKFGVEGFTQVLADELKETAIAVFSVNPGHTRTTMRAAAVPEEDPLTNPHPDEVARAILRMVQRPKSEVHGRPLDARDFLKP